MCTLGQCVHWGSVYYGTVCDNEPASTFDSYTFFMVYVHEYDTCTNIVKNIDTHNIHITWKLIINIVLYTLLFLLLTYTVTTTSNLTIITSKTFRIFYSFFLFLFFRLFVYSYASVYSYVFDIILLYITIPF